MTQPPNPYESPPPVDPELSWWERVRNWFAKPRFPRVTPNRFSQGHALIFSGIAYFIDPKVPGVLYAASPSSIDTDARLDLIESEAREHLPALLAASPRFKKWMVGRRLVIRIIETYSDRQESFSSERVTDHVIELQATNPEPPSET